MADKDTKNVAEGRKQAQAETAKAVEANTGIKAPTAAQLQAAQKEGVAEAIKENAKEVYSQAADGNLPGDPPNYRDLSSDETTHLAPNLELGVEAFEELVKDKERLSEDSAAALLKLERAGQNRAPYVKALMARLKVKSPYEITSAGPGYLNEVSPISVV